MDGWTYGAEHEFSDWDARPKLPDGFGRAPDYTIVNSNSIAAHPDVKVYWLGGEFNTPPTDTPDGQVECLQTILEHYPECLVNHRSNLHIHVRVPGLKDDLQLLQRIQLYIHRQLRPLINKLEPIPISHTPAERKREKRRYISHHTFLTKQRLLRQLVAQTTTEFFEREVPTAQNGRVLWHLQPRLCVNLRQLLQTDTIEFRHFPGTTDADELLTCIEWCRDFLSYAISNQELAPLLHQYRSTRRFPNFAPFNEEFEIGYQATCAHGKFSKQEIVENIKTILQGNFNGTEAHTKATALARGLSW